MKALEETKAELDTYLAKERAFDIKTRDLCFAGHRAVYYFINGYVDSDIMQRVHSFFLEQNGPIGSMQEFADARLPFGDIKIVTQISDFANEILRGSVVFLMDPFPEGIAIDLRSFASRGVEEPQKNRTLRGPHEGFNENMVSNLVLIRRHMRTSLLRAENFSVGKKVKNEVALLYMEGKTDEALLDRLRKRLSSTEISSLSMAQETLANLLFPQKGLSLANPFPRVRYTERPDVVSATLLEGKIVLLCDNSPSAMLLPESIFDFFEEADDYYFPPITASYLRIVRALVFIASIFVVPIWLLVAKHSEYLPTGLNFVVSHEDFAVPLYLQCLIIELALDGLRMASLNTPDPLANSFSIVGGLLLGDFAVSSGWFIPQTILYSSFTAIANFVPTNYELGYSFKFMRMSLILLVEFFGLWGLLGGTLAWAIILFTTRSFAGKTYLYPFLPFDWNGIRKIFLKGTYGKEKF